MPTAKAVALANFTSFACPLRGGSFLHGQARGFLPLRGRLKLRHWDFIGYWKSESRREGFTIVESFFVMLLITLFTSLAAGYVQRVRQEARDVKGLADLRQVSPALPLFAPRRCIYPLGTPVLLGAPEPSPLAHRGGVSAPEDPAYLPRLE